MPTLAVVEDDPFVSKIIRATAARQGWGCVLFEDVSEAIEHKGLNDFDLALVDVITPRSDAFELLAVMARNGVCVPIVLTSAHPEYLRLATALAEAYRVDLRGSLAKPLRVPDVSKLLAKFH